MIILLERCRPFVFHLGPHPACILRCCNQGCTLSCCLADQMLRLPQIVFNHRTGIQLHNGCFDNHEASNLSSSPFSSSSCRSSDPPINWSLIKIWGTVRIPVRFTSSS